MGLGLLDAMALSQPAGGLCKNGNQTTRMGGAVLGAGLQEKPPVKMGHT